MRQLFAVIQQPEKGPETAPAQQQSDPSGSPAGMMLLMLAIFVAFWFFMIRPMKQKEKRDRDTLVASLKKNDEVLTAAGIIGVITSIKDEEVTLKTDDTSNARLRVLKSTVIRVMNPKEPSKDGQSADSAKSGATPGK